MRLLANGWAVVLIVAVTLSRSLYGQSTLSLFVQSLDKTSGEVEINSGDTRTSTTPFIFDWGDSTLSTGFFPQRHTYHDLSKNYVVQVTAHYTAGTTEYAEIKVTFIQSTAIVTTVAGADPGRARPATQAGLYYPRGIAFDSAGNLVIADFGFRQVRKVTPGGIMSTIAGNGQAGYSLDDGIAAIDAVVSYPTDVAFDHNGNLYISDQYCHCVRKVSPQGIISTAAGIKAGGNGRYGGDGGPASSAFLNEPSGLAFDSFENLYIADRINGRIRKVNTAGVISTFALVPNPRFIAIDTSNNLYVTSGNPSLIHKITPAGAVSTFAGGGSIDGGDGGPATSVRIFADGLRLDTQGNLYIVEVGGIRKVTPAGIISTVAGNGMVGFGGDNGPALAATLYTGAGSGFFPGIAFDSTGGLYFSDSVNNRVRRISVGGTITTFAGGGGGLGDGGLALNADLNSPYDVALDFAGNLYIADTQNARVRKVAPDGRISTVAGNGIWGFSGDGGPATLASVSPYSVTVDSAGNLYISDSTKVRRVNAGGIITTVMNFPGPDPGNLNGNFGLATDSSGNLYVAGGGYHRVFKVTPSGTASTIAGDGSIGYSGDGGPGSAAQINNPSGVALDASGAVYLAECGNHIIRKVSTSGVISTIAGDGSMGYAGDGGPALSAKLGCPRDLAVDAAGNLYFSDNLFEIIIRKVDPAGIISTVAGAGTKSISDGSLATEVKFGLSIPGVSLDSSGNLYIADTTNHRIRKLTFIPPDAFLTTRLNPASVLEAEPGFTLAVSGVNFQTGDTVQWNGSSRPTTFVSSTQLTATISTSDVLNPGTAQVTVARGTIVSSPFSFSIVANTAPPVITQVLPPNGSSLANSKITILGDNFKSNLATGSGIAALERSDAGVSLEQTGGEGVFLGGKKLAQVTFVSRKQLDALTVAGSSGKADLTIVQATGSATLPNAYTYTTFPSVPPLGGGQPPRRRWLIPFVVDSSAFRTNLGINNVSETPAKVDILLVENNGLLIAQISTTVAPFGMKQINNVVQDLEKSVGLSGREGYLILESAEEIRAWASQIDNVSADPSLELARTESESAVTVLLPSSVSNSRFQTALLITNATDTSGSVTIRSRNGKGEVQGSLTNKPIAARGYLFFEDLYRILGLSNVSGPVEVEATGGIKIRATERIYTSEYTSAYFEGVDPSTASQVVVLPFSVDTADFRTNLGINNPGVTQANVTVSLINKEGISVGSLTTSVPPKGLTQLNDINRQLLGSTTVTNREGMLRLESDQRIVAWTSQIDNVTQDPSLVVGKSSSTSKLLIPSTTSAGNFKSTLAVVNLAATPTTVQITARDNDGNIRGTSTLTIAGQGLVTFTDVLQALGLVGTFGPLEIASTNGSPLLAVSRVYSTQRTGGYFEGLPVTTETPP
jgi:sugar lactone lactonase YvrE